MCENLKLRVKPMAPTNSKNPLLLNDQLCFALYATSRAITKVYSDSLGSLGVTYPQYLSLLALWENDGLTVQELAAKLEIEGATATPLVQRLEKLGLVDRKRDSNDERRVHILLTVKGKNLRAKALSVPTAIASALDISAKDSLAMIEHLNELRSKLR